jgi:peptidoglycan hydrolase CwlO-like protein
MEPIRPDDDELRAERPIGSAETKKPAERKSRPASGGKGEPLTPTKPPKGGKGGNGGSGGNGRGSSPMLWVLLIVLAVAAGAGWYSQEQRVQALEGQLEEADYWARQSKLALARFEGELSETGENLQERGASLEDQLAANKKRLDTADSEIRKLWAIANERNKKRLDEQQERIAALESGLAEGKKSIGALETSAEKVRSSLSADIAALKQQTETSITALQDANRQATDQLTKLSQQLADVDQVIESRIRRFEQEQKLGISGMEGRISALERETDELAGDGRVQALRNDVASLKRTVESIDASRSQLTSRLVRLSEEVNQLRSQVSGQ